MEEQLGFATSAVHAHDPQVIIKSFKTFSRLSRKKRMRAYVLMNQHDNGEAGAANEQSAVNLLAAAGLRADAGSFEPGQGQGKKMGRRAVESGKYHILVMFGGDGSVNKGVQAVMHADNVSLGVICGGTVNLCRQKSNTPTRKYLLFGQRPAGVGKPLTLPVIWPLRKPRLRQEPLGNPLDPQCFTNW